MSALVDNLLDMARIQSGEVQAAPRSGMPIEEVVGSALQVGAGGARPAPRRRRAAARTCRWSSSTPR